MKSLLLATMLFSSFAVFAQTTGSGPGNNAEPGECKVNIAGSIPNYGQVPSLLHSLGSKGYEVVDENVNLRIMFRDECTDIINGCPPYPGYSFHGFRKYAYIQANTTGEWETIKKVSSRTIKNTFLHETDKEFKQFKVLIKGMPSCAL